ncbi:MAG: TldD/PmbA family protein, partial [Dehalococcoidia bacterium]
MDELLLRALDLARMRGAGYADIRRVNTTQERFVVRSGVVDTLSKDESTGFGVRVQFNGAWGFASSYNLSPAEVDRVTDLAVQIAKASALLVKEPAPLGPPVSSRGTYTTPIQIDPFTIPASQKIDLLLAADRGMASVQGIRSRQANLIFIKEDKVFANSEGAYVEQTIYEAGGGMQATAVGEGEVQRRSYPQTHGRHQGCAGWEYIAEMNLAENAERVASEAVALLTADSCPADTITTVIIGGSQLALQVHESCGHPIELDRVLGAEAAYAGTSFLTPEKLNNFQYGSEQVNITADSLRLPGLGTFGWDDEGVPAQSTPIVQNGRFVGYLMSRETAHSLGLASNGCMRAASWNRIPMIRMTNVSLEPGSWELEDLIADTDDGILMETNRSWSIDDLRYNFQFGTEMGYE